MNLQSINESFKKIVHGTSYTNSLREALGEGADGEKLELADGLFNAIRSLRGKGVSDLKTYEKAFQDVLERIFPEKDWFEVTSVNIFWDLMSTKDPEQTAINILADIYRPEETAETEETVEVTEDTVKRGGKWMNVGKDGSHGTFRTKKAADAQRKAMFARGFKEAYGSEKHPEQDAIEAALKNIRGTERVEFDYRPNDGVYKKPEDHLIALVFTDNMFAPSEGEDDPNDENWFKNRAKWKKLVLRRLDKMGWELEDPMEDNDTYLYLVLKKKEVQESKTSETKGKKLTEGAGAGYTIRGEVSRNKTFNKIEITPNGIDGDNALFTVKCDIDATLEDVSAHSYYYGTPKKFNAPIKITEVKLSVYAEDLGGGTLSVEEAKEIINTISTIETTIGGGWSHTTFDGNIDVNIYRDTLESPYDEVTDLSFRFLDDYQVKYIDRAVLGDLYTEGYVVRDREGEIIADDFEKLADAMSFAKNNKNAQYVVKDTFVELSNGNVDLYDSEVVWSRGIDESVKNSKNPITEAVDTDDRRKALADHLGVDIETITTSSYDDKTFETEDGEEYLVLDSDEAREAAIEAVKNDLDDMGIESFTDDFKDWAYRNAIETDWFDDALRESEEFYADDIESEDDNEYGNRLIHEMYDEGILEDDDFEKDEDGEIDYTRVKETVDIDSKKEDFVDKLVENMGDAVEWYRSEFGEDELARTVRDNNLIDADAVAEEAIDWDGVEHFLASYDGEEIELDDGWYAYRTN